VLPAKSIADKPHGLEPSRLSGTGPSTKISNPLLLDTFFCTQFGGPFLKTYDFKVLHAKSVADKPPGLEPSRLSGPSPSNKSAMHFWSTLFCAPGTARKYKGNNLCELWGGRLPMA